MVRLPPTYGNARRDQRYGTKPPQYLTSHDIIMVFCWLSPNLMASSDLGESNEKLQVGKTQKQGEVEREVPPLFFLLPFLESRGRKSLVAWVWGYLLSLHSTATHTIHRLA